LATPRAWLSSGGIRRIPRTADPRTMPHLYIFLLFILLGILSTCALMI